jgi:hypothetical protein
MIIALKKVFLPVITMLQYGSTPDSLLVPQLANSDYLRSIKGGYLGEDWQQNILICWQS